MEVHDIVQIVDESHPWFPALLVVTEVMSWGIQAYVMIPTNNDEPASCNNAFNRLRNEQVEVVGRVVIAQTHHIVEDIARTMREGRS